MNPFLLLGLDRFNPAQGGVRGMRIAATGLLIVMAAIFLLARSQEAPDNYWGFVRAFAEAAMVGGLADWFAVTALFRHPLGLPIPHTAIIPRNKDRIGDNLAAFLRENFLTSSVVARRMGRIDVAAAAGRFLANPASGGRLRSGASRLVADVLEALDPERLGSMVRYGIAARVRALSVAPLLGQALTAAIAENRHVPIVDGIIVWAGKTLDANEALIRGIVNQRAGAILRWTGLDEKLANAILGGLHKLLSEMAADPEHPVRAKSEEALRSLAERMQHDPELQARIETVKEEIIDNPAVDRWMEGLWESARAAMLKAARDPDTTLAGRFGDALRQLGATLQTEPRLRHTINQFTRRATVGAIDSYGDHIVRLVSDTIRGWDAKTITMRLESAVGRDLQYIRINGTVVGGLVGLAIHLVDRLV
jgi:uncharacterized membrane-anchored protein YjiN (DUF445 family)